eukprot:TRINITY_DN64538_c0_g1_i2.p3 TRINITY_DN64538_c0_g1~~TRINITY_DN64538_c0_g1_i2.p3  ORF type:complete len:161 (+),score=15.44 TRINITY_DN64538_c0_g1_i2:71-553(+)
MKNILRLLWEVDPTMGSDEDEADYKLEAPAKIQISGAELVSHAAQKKLQDLSENSIGKWRHIYLQTCYVAMKGCESEKVNHQTGSRWKKKKVKKVVVKKGKKRKEIPKETEEDQPAKEEKPTRPRKNSKDVGEEVEERVAVDAPRVGVVRPPWLQGPCCK